MRHLPNLKFDHAVIHEVLSHGGTYRHAKTGEVVTGIFSSFLTRSLRDYGWKPVGTPNDVEDVAARAGLRVLKCYEPGLWEEKCPEYRGKSGWRKVKQYTHIVAADAAFISGRA